MKNLLKITAATAALALGVSGANAALLLHEDAQGQKVVVNTETESEAQVLMSETGEAPAECPEGSFWFYEDAGEQWVTECVTGTRFLAGEIEEGTMPAEDIPQGAFLLSEESLTGQKEVETERRGAEMPGEIEPHGK